MRLNARLCAAGALAVALSLVGCQKSNENVQAARETGTDTGDKTKKAVLSESDKNFVKKAEEGDIKERDLGRVALEKSQNKDVKDYAQTLVDDHSKNLKGLIELMNQKGMPQRKGLPKVQHEALSKLNGLSAAAFDREFVNVMVQDHQKDITQYRQEVNSTQDEDVKHYAMHTLPTLEEHLRKAQQLQQKLSSGSQTR